MTGNRLAVAAAFAVGAATNACAQAAEKLTIVRYVVAGIRVSPEVAEYPDLKKITAQARTNSQTGERLWVIHDLEVDSDPPNA